MVANIVRALKRINGEDGQALAEYTLVLAFVLVVCALVLGALGLAVSGQFQAFADGF